MVGMTQPDIALYIAVHRSAAIAIGVLVSLVINVVLFPDYAHETLKERFVLQRAKTLKWICEIARRYMSADYRMEPVEAQYRDLIQGLRSLRKLLGDAGFEMKLLSGDPELLKSPAGPVECTNRGVLRFLSNTLPKRDAKKISGDPSGGHGKPAETPGPACQTR